MKRNSDEHMVELLKRSDGILRHADAIELGVPNATFYNFVRRNGLERVAKGVYLHADAFPDEMQLLQVKFPKAIFSHDTALYLHGLSEREPVPLSVTVHSNYHSDALRDTGTRIYYVKEPWHELGAMTLDSPEGNPVRVYDMERTICDTIRRRSATDPSAFNYAMRKYAASKEKDLRRLGEYSAEMGMEQRVSDVLEVLL